MKKQYPFLNKVKEAVKNDSRYKVYQAPRGGPRIKGYKKCQIDGLKFDSKREAQHYLYLKDQLHHGSIRGFKCQVKYELIPNQRTLLCRVCDGEGAIHRVGLGLIPVKCKLCNGKGYPKESRIRERAVSYYADFVVDENDGTKSVIDVKGFRTEMYRIKKKLMLYFHGVIIKEV